MYYKLSSHSEDWGRTDEQMKFRIIREASFIITSKGSLYVPLMCCFCNKKYRLFYSPNLSLLFR